MPPSLTNKYEAPGVESPLDWVVCEEVETLFMACFAPCMAEDLSTELWAALPTERVCGLLAQFCLEVRAFGFSMTLSGWHVLFLCASCAPVLPEGLIIVLGP